MSINKSSIMTTESIFFASPIPG